MNAIIRGGRARAGNKFPDHLDGSLPGDAGFDPLSLGSDPQLLKWCAPPLHDISGRQATLRCL